MISKPVVYIVDDDQAVRESLVWLVESVGINTRSFSSAQAFLDAHDEGAVGCVLSDLRMHGMSGVELQKTMTSRNILTPFILMTAFGDVLTAVKVMKAGAVDFVEKPFNDQDMLDLINKSLVADEARLKQAEESKETTDRIARLTSRERKVFALVVEGNSNKQISREMDISIKTVEVHRSRVMRKLEVQSVAELVQLHVKAEQSEPKRQLEDI